MADLAIGLSKKAVDGLVKKVEKAIKEEKELWQTVERDSVFIKDEFEMMKSFLHTVDRDRVRNSVVRTWVRQVRDLSYHAEDCIDGVLELEPKRPWWALSFWPRMLPTSCRPGVGKALDEAVDRIKLIKARVEEVSQRNLRYNLINTTGSGQMQQAATAMMDMDLDLAKVQEGSLRLRALLDYEARHGRLNVISVWGTGGNLGTMSIIKHVFDHPLVCQAYTCRAWVKLMHPFSPKKFLGDLVAQLHTNSGACGADVLSKIEKSPVDLATEVEQLLKDDSYLIVLEDLSNMEEWHTIRTYLPGDANRSQQVIVSSQHRRIARLCIGQPQYVQELSQLSADDCVYAFFEEIRIPSEQNQGSTASLSATANHWYYLLPNICGDEGVRQLSDRIERRAPNDARVVTVLLGVPDNGKDADVVAKVCSQLVLNTSSFQLYGWVNVPNPFDVWSFSEYLLSVLRPKSPKYSRDPVQECSRLLEKYRCLVVINSLQRKEDCSALERAGLINKHSNSCIVVVTTEESVATFSFWTKTQEEEATPAALCNDIDESLSGQQDRLLHSIAGSSSSLELKDFADYWYNHCISGRDEELHQLYYMISSSGGQYNGRVLTVWTPPDVWATPDVGKNTLMGLVAKVYSHYVLTDPSPFRLYGWVDVSSNSNPEITLEDFLSQSLLSYMQPQVPNFGTDDTAGPIQNCINLLARYSCLVVIDGLQSVDDCHKLINARFIDGYRHSCFILITEKESVATFWKQTSSTNAVCNVEPLEGQRQRVKLRRLRPRIPRIMLPDITRLFDMANWWFPNFSTIIGRHDEVRRLSSMISSSTGQNSTRVIVIWGPPGVGKTAVVEQVFSQLVLKYNRLVSDRPFVLFGWSQVSNPFNLMGFSRRLLSVLRPQSPESSDPIVECSNIVRNHPCLVVIDGLQCVENFHELANAGLIYGHPNSCIVLITTEKCMASLVPKDALFQVNPLDRASAEELFNQVYEPYWTDKDFVVDKCCGLPIVIFAVAKYLSTLTEDQVTQFTAAVKDGMFIRELATNTRLQFVGLKGLLAWVDADLKDCPESLKLFIMYMLNFSQETIVRRKRLVRRWIAEGYIKNTGICDMVIEAEERVRELEGLTMTMMMLVAPWGRHRGYQLSGFSGEVLLSRAAEDPLFLPLEVSTLTEGKHRLTSRGCAGRHLRIDKRWERNEFVFRSLDLSRLRSLTVNGHFEAFFINESMKMLRVLDLEDAWIQNDYDLKEIPKRLPRLRFLSLRRCIDIDHLPDSIGDLKQLQTLDIRGTRITTLPSSIIKLRNLQCLRAGHSMKAQTTGDPYVPAWRRLRGLASCSWQTQKCYASQGVTMPRGTMSQQGVTMPRGMSQLTALHTLGIVNVNIAGGEATLEELRHLQQLRKLELYGINSYNAQGLRHLRRISLDSLSLGFTKDVRDATSSSFYTALSELGWPDRLKLYGHVGILEVLPSDMRVTDLTLEIETSLAEDNMQRIWERSNVLRTLRLHFHTRQEGGELKFDANIFDFPLLEVLEISSLDSSPLHVEFGPGALKSLVALKCVGSLKIRQGELHKLGSLKEVWVRGRSLEQAMGQVLEDHPNKPAVIDFGRWDDMRYPERDGPLVID